MPTLRNINPLGAVDLPLIGRSLAAGEEFDVTDEQAGTAPSFDENGVCTDLGSGLLAQIGNYELVPPAATAKKKG